MSTESTDSVPEADAPGSASAVAPRDPDALGIEVSDNGACSRRVRISVPAARVDREIEHTLRNVQRNVQFKGFRPGKAPRRLVEARLGDRVLADVKERLVEAAVNEAVKETGLDTIGEAQATWDEIEVRKGADLEFDVLVDVRPEFEVPDLASITVTRPALTVEDDDVEAEIEKLRMARATTEEAGDDALAERGVAVLGVKIEIEGEVVVDEPEVEWQHPSDVLGGMVVPDMPSSLLGKARGDAVELTVTLPDNFVTEQFRGKEAHLRLTVEGVQHVSVPDLDDTFAAELDFDDVAELRDDVRKQLERGLEDAARKALDDRIVDAILDATPFEVPPAMVRRETGRMLQRFETQLRQDGVDEARISEEVAHAHAEAEGRVTRDLRASFVLDKVASARKVFATETEVHRELASMGAAYNQSAEAMAEYMERNNLMTSLRASIRERKTIDGLRDLVQITEGGDA